MIFLDFETQSQCDLRTSGGRQYARDPSTRVLCLAAVMPDDSVLLWIPPHGGVSKSSNILVPWPQGWERRDVKLVVSESAPEELLSDPTLVAHNADMFDKHVWQEKVSRDPVQWIDTMHLCRAAGYRGGIDSAAERILAKKKDDLGHKMMLKLCKLDAEGRNRFHLPGNVGLVASYCIADALLLQAVYHHVASSVTVDAPILQTHREINDRGVRFDSDLAHKLILWGERASEEAREKIREKAPEIADNLRSIPKMTAWLEGHGIDLPDLRKDTVEMYLAAPEEFSEVVPPKEVAEILELRKACLRITASKLNSGISSVCPDGRLRDMFTYYGAHTGRWSGRRIQLQNLPRGINGLDILGLIEGRVTDVQEAERLGVRLDQVHSTMIRPCLMATDEKHELVIADYSAIECRGVAWLAGEKRLLEVFREKQDPYCVMASRIYGREITKNDSDERQVGKVVVLGCGYQMAGERLEDYAAGMGINLAAAGVTGEQCVTAFREAFPRLPLFWRQLNNAAVSACNGMSSSVGHCTFTPQNGMTIVLPSGRKLTYRRARVENRTPKWGGDPMPQVVYESPRGWTSTFGGKLAENVTQAVARDLLGVAMVRCKLPVVLHAHDEIVVDSGIDDSYNVVESLCEAMTTTPAWASGFPLSVEWHTGTRYTKSVLPGGRHGVYHGN